MPDFIQTGPITTLHDLGTAQRGDLESMIDRATRDQKLGLVLPVTASDMRAAPFAEIVNQLKEAPYIEHIVITLGVAPDERDYRETAAFSEALGERAVVLWTDGPRVRKIYETLIKAGFRLDVPGKGRSVWTAFGYLLADSRLKAFALHDCDIVDYDRLLLCRLCLPMVHKGFNFEFCKAFYTRVTDRMHGRVVRLLVRPLIQALTTLLGADRFLTFMDSFRYPLSGEFAMTSAMARSNRIASDWGLEVGTLAEVFRNTSIKKVCQVDIGRPYEHKHQDLSLEDPNKGLMKMAGDILTTMFRTLASMGKVFEPSHFITLRSVYRRAAQDAIRQYHADSIMNKLTYDRHDEENAVDGFAEQITSAGEVFRTDLAGGEMISNWTRTIAAYPDLPQQLRDAVRDDAKQYS